MVISSRWSSVASLAQRTGGVTGTAVASATPGTGGTVVEAGVQGTAGGLPPGEEGTGGVTETSLGTTHITRTALGVVEITTPMGPHHLATILTACPPGGWEEGDLGPPGAHPLRLVGWDMAPRQWGLQVEGA